MKVLVTGGAGFIGSAIAKSLVAAQHEVVIYDDLSGGKTAAVPDGATLIVGDIRNLDALVSAARGAEVIYHQAAVKSVPRSLDEPLLVHETNATGTLNVLIAGESVGARRLIYASSSSVYGNVEGRSREEFQPQPLSPYGVSKLAGEHYCQVWSRLERLETVCLRYFNVFGPGQPADSKYAAVFPAFISALLAGEAPTIHGDGQQSRDFTYIEDVVRANLLAASAPDAGGEVLNVAGGTPRTVNEVFASVRDAIGASIEPTHSPRRAGDINHSYADSTRANNLLAWAPEVSWQEAVLATTNWFRSAEPIG